MNHNKLNLQEGQHVMLDADKANRSEVVISSFTPLGMYALVYNAALPGDKWQVMTYRLSNLKNKK